MRAAEEGPVIVGAVAVVRAIGEEHVGQFRAERAEDFAAHVIKAEVRLPYFTNVWTFAHIVASEQYHARDDDIHSAYDLLQ